MVGQRVIAYAGVLFGFTSGGLEIWQDTAQPFPAFPYSRQAVLPYGLIQPAAIAGFEAGFDNLIWVAQDYGVYQLPWGSYSPSKISPPDLDRFIEVEIGRKNLLEAGCYEFAGKKFWTLTSNNGSVTWEFNLSTQKWNERTSLSLAIGAQSRWRGAGGHPAFNRWLMGDTQSGNLLYPDDTNYTDNGAPQLVRIESGPVNGFPQQFRITRADFEFVTGVGGSVGNVTKSVLNVTASPTAPLIRMTLNNTARMASGDRVNVTGVAGTGGVDTATNGTWIMTLIDGFQHRSAGLDVSGFLHRRWLCDRCDGARQRHQSNRRHLGQQRRRHQLGQSADLLARPAGQAVARAAVGQGHGAERSRWACAGGWTYPMQSIRPC